MASVSDVSSPRRLGLGPTFQRGPAARAERPAQPRLQTGSTPRDASPDLGRAPPSAGGRCRPPPGAPAQRDALGPGARPRRAPPAPPSIGRPRADGRSAGARALERRDGAPPLTPLTVETLPGGLAEVLLPAGAGGLSGYQAALQAGGAFPAEAARVAALPATTSRPFAADERPTVGIILAELAQLTPHLDELPGLRSVVAEVERLGARPVLIPPRLDLVLPADQEARRRALDGLTRQLDGVIGLGGDDVDPSLYGEPVTYAVDTDPARDRAEVELVRSAMGADSYMFGICRSHQLWNVARGARLIQDIEQEGFAHLPHHTRAFGLPNRSPLVVPSADGPAFEHRVRLARGSQARRILHQPDVLTNARHHQAIRAPGESLRATGRVHDPVTGRELIEVTENDHVLTVQFHPEDMVNEAHGLLEAAIRRAHIFRFFKEAAARGELERGVAPVLERMAGGPFHPSDFDWARRALTARLRRGVGPQPLQAAARSGGPCMLRPCASLEPGAPSSPSRPS